MAGAGAGAGAGAAMLGMPGGMQGFPGPEMARGVGMPPQGYGLPPMGLPGLQMPSGLTAPQLMPHGLGHAMPAHQVGLPPPPPPGVPLGASPNGRPPPLPPGAFQSSHMILAPRAPGGAGGQGGQPGYAGYSPPGLLPMSPAPAPPLGHPSMFTAPVMGAANASVSSSSGGGGIRPVAVAPGATPEEILQHARDALHAVPASSLGSADSRSSGANALASERQSPTAKMPAAAAAESRAEGAVASGPRWCHLHTKKPSSTCKTCQRVKAASQTSATSAPARDDDRGSKPREEERSSRDEDGGKPSFQCSPMLKDQILKSSYFKSLMNISTVEGLAEEIQSYAEGLDVYQAGSATSPSVFFCCVFRLFTMEHTQEELEMILDFADSAFVRCVGFLYARFSVRPDRLWETFDEYILDDMDLGPARAKGGPSNVGEYVESLLMKEKYFGTPLPRLPVVVRRKLEERIAPLPQYRKRAQANRRALKNFREAGTAVEVCKDGQWLPGKVVELASSVQSRIKVNVRLDGKDGDELLVHLGKVIMRNSAASSGSEAGSDAENGGKHGRRRKASRSRSRRRGRSPDWSRWKGKSDSTMVKELRERAREEAVCGSGKEYAKRPMGFEAGLAIRREQGTAESKLIEEDTFSSVQRATGRRLAQEDDEESDRRHSRRIDEEQERQRKLAQIFEKYGKQVSSTSSKVRDVEAPDVMRLG